MSIHDRNALERRTRTPARAACRRLPAWALALVGFLASPGGDLAGQSLASLSPPRNRCTPVPGEVECLDQHAGLIHGAVIKMPSSRLTCRAFRQFWLYRYLGRSSRAETREVVVAGVCEHTRLDGTLIRRWSSADRLPITTPLKDLWTSLGVPLPQPVVRKLPGDESGKRKNWTFTGYYLPRGWNFLASTDATAPADFNHWPALGAVQPWSQAPAGGESVESPLFDRPVSCSSGYAVCSPYLSILVHRPDEASAEARVEMVRARRYFSYRTGDSLVYQHDATLLPQVFTDP